MAPDLPQFPFARPQGYEPPHENAKLRKECPVTKVKTFDGKEHWWVGKYGDVCKVLASEKMSKDRRNPGYPELHPGGREKATQKKPTFVDSDDPDHAYQRSMLEYSFMPEAVEELRPMIQKTVDEVINKMMERKRPGEPVDLVDQFASPVPTIIIYRMLGVPEEDIDDLSRDSEVRNSASTQAAESSNTNLQDYMSKLVGKKIENPGDDLISKMVVEHYQKGRLQRDEVDQLAFLVLVAGNATLINLIGLGTFTMLQHPDQLNDFKKDTKVLAKPMVNELLRYHTASALNGRRVAIKDFTLRGLEIKAGEGVITSNQAADRDEEIYTNPDEWDIHRKHPVEVLGFGHGPHRCQAEWLSRAELEITFSTLFSKLPNLKLAVKESEVEFTPAAQNVGITKLMIDCLETQEISGFRNPWPSWHKPSSLEVWQALEWGEDIDPCIQLARSRVTELRKLGRSSESSLSSAEVPMKSNKSQAAELLRVVKPDFSFDAQEKRAKTTWLGHAGVLVQLPQLNEDSEVRNSASTQAAESSNTNLQEYMSKLVGKKIENPGDDLISKMVVEHYQKGRLQRDEVDQLAFLVLVAGNATLINLIGLGTFTMLQHPDQLNNFKKDTKVLAKPMVNELLRYHTASALNGRRVAIKDFTLRGLEIKAGEGVITSNQAADRDEEIYTNPDEWDIHRKHPVEVLGFGHGPHRCQAEWLSRAELEITFSTLFSKLPNLKLAVKESEVEFTPAAQNVGITKLMIDCLETQEISGFRNPWPSWHKPSSLEVWQALEWGEDIDPCIQLARSRVTELRKLGRSSESSLSSAEVPMKSNKSQAAELLRVMKPDFSFDAQEKRAKTAWLGHAGVLVQLPQLNECGRPTAGPIRSYPPPCAVEDLPEIDVVMISHNHYDHLDFDTIMTLWKNHAKHMRFLVPLGNRQWFLDSGIDPGRVVELDWWDGVHLTAPDANGNEHSSLSITCTPSQHSSGRSGTDANTTL
ncbi:hypothetical protein B0A55_01995 [Friedmanniomyces simplex]|uniref:Metallo-beta-lactamase domain-containing protein n=1 Tax=Friedmanniomyces simplex TaxID=329884 RepID=A0A4U0XPW7_9PEZI|nr:hypothetical protein B0A55_01995 [Friedmanniomyces simplex]